MPHYQSLAGAVYYFDPTVANPLLYLPAGSTLITDAQAATLLGLPSDLQAAKTAKIYGSYTVNGKTPGLVDAYNAAITQAVSFTTAAGTTKTFQADPGSVSNLQAAIAGCTAAGTTPSGFYWVAADNTQVPFAYADLHGLAAAMFGQGAIAFQHLQSLKAAVNSATTVSDVNAIGW